MVESTLLKCYYGSKLFDRSISLYPVFLLLPHQIGYNYSGAPRYPSSAMHQNICLLCCLFDELVSFVKVLGQIELVVVVGWYVEVVGQDLFGMLKKGPFSHRNNSPDIVL